MSRSAWLVVAAVVLTIAGGALGGWIGVRYGLHEAHADVSLDEVLHHRLKLSPEQNARIETLESAFNTRRTALEAEMQAANRQLARALETQHAYGPDAEQAVARFHVAMSALQEATIQHILAMRAVLTSQQAAQFDRTISETLAPGGR
ncbi:MAG: periplasmic heavy metal sensor [Alphaproteobacteria bacterium]